jgi:hypothetical protein
MMMSLLMGSMKPISDFDPREAKIKFLGRPPTPGTKGAAGGNFRLLRMKRTSPQALSDDGLVSPNRGLDQRALTVAGGGLPFHPTVSFDCADMQIPLAES